MKIRNPFKDYLGRWKDDATTSFLLHACALGNYLGFR
jgi:hypothetical protein